MADKEPKRAHRSVGTTIHQAVSAMVMADAADIRGAGRHLWQLDSSSCDWSDAEIRYHLNKLGVRATVDEVREEYELQMQEAIEDDEEQWDKDNYG